MAIRVTTVAHNSSGFTLHRSYELDLYNWSAITKVSQKKENGKKRLRKMKFNVSKTQNL